MGQVNTLLDVTPFVGVWIEMKKRQRKELAKNVTPFVGVWIEIQRGRNILKTEKSHSLRGSVD